MIVYGWTLHQWAEVAAWFETRNQWLPLPDYAGMVDVTVEWWKARPDEPAGRRLIATDHPLGMNYAWARRMFVAVAIACGPTAPRSARNGR